MVYQHDPRHVDVLVKDFRLEHGNSVQTPATHDVTDEEPEPLNQHTTQKLQVASCLMFVPQQDGADTTFIVTESCQSMSNPPSLPFPPPSPPPPPPHTQQSRAMLKRLVRYLKRERKWRQVFSYGRMVEEVTTYSDSYWAGCQEIRKSSSAGVMQLGSRTLDAYTRKQHIIASCSAETELYAAALGASDTKGMVWSFCDLGYD